MPAQSPPFPHDAVAPSYTFEQDPVTGRLPTINYVRAHVQECGGEPELQQWTFDQPMKGFVRNAKANVCLNVEGCKTDVIYDGCTTTGGASARGEETAGCLLARPGAFWGG